MERERKRERDRKTEREREREGQRFCDYFLNVPIFRKVFFHDRVRSSHATSSNNVSRKHFPIFLPRKRVGLK